jgi:hypothetical protein
MSTKPQPIGVRVVAILYFVSTIWFVALLVLLLSSRSTLERLLNGLAVAGEHPLLRLGALLPLYFSAMALVVGAIGWGLWRYLNWARLLTLLLLAVSLIATGWQTVESFENLKGSDLVRSLVGIVLIGLATWYFTRKRVRQAFGSA